MPWARDAMPGGDRERRPPLMTIPALDIAHCADAPAPGSFGLLERGSMAIAAAA